MTPTRAPLLSISLSNSFFMLLRLKRTRYPAPAGFYYLDLLNLKAAQRAIPARSLNTKFFVCGDALLPGAARQPLGIKPARPPRCRRRRAFGRARAAPSR